MATRVSHLPPVGSLFAAFLGYNPMQVLLGHAELSHLPHATAHYLTSRQFFPHLISLGLLPGPHRGLLLRGRRVPARCRGVAPAWRQVPPRGRRVVVTVDRRADWVPAQEAVAETEPLLVD